MSDTSPHAGEGAGVRTCRRRPVDVQAVQVTEENVKAVAAWITSLGFTVRTYDSGAYRIFWDTGQASIGHVVTHRDGEVQALPLERFEAEFEEREEQ